MARGARPTDGRVSAARPARIVSWGGLFLFLIALAACVPAAKPTALPTLAAAAPPLPSHTPTFVPTATSSPVASPTSTVTPSPTATVTPTPSATPCGETAGRWVSGTFPSPVQRGEGRYLIYLPPCYGQTGRLYPALYLFHGNIYTEQHWVDVGIGQAADAGMGSGALPPFVIVLPFDGEIANNTSGGDWSFEGVVLNELIPYVESRYCIWPEPAGRAIGGISRGGYWSLEIGFRHPERFAAVGGHSAALFPDNAGPIYNPLTTGTDPKLIGLPIYLDIGEDDWLRQGVFDLHDAMEAAGVPHEWHLNPGAHSDAYWAEHVAEYLVWYGSHWPAEADYPPAAGRDCSP